MRGYLDGTQPSLPHGGGGQGMWQQWRSPLEAERQHRCDGLRGTSSAVATPHRCNLIVQVYRCLACDGPARCFQQIHVFCLAILLRAVSAGFLDFCVVLLLRGFPMEGSRKKQGNPGFPQNVWLWGNKLHVSGKEPHVLGTFRIPEYSICFLVFVCVFFLWNSRFPSQRCFWARNL